MIVILHLDKKEYPYGFSVLNVKANESVILNKSARGNFYHMFFVKSGEVNLQIDTHLENITKGECGFIGINQVFKVTTPTDFEVLILKFDESFYCRHDIDIHFLNSCFFFDNSTGIVKHLLDSATQLVLEQHYDVLSDISQKPYNDLMYHISHNTVERLLLFCQKRLIYDADQLNTVINPDNDLMHNFRQLVKMHFRQEKQLQFYADTLNTSIKRLTEACKNIYDQSPKKIITEQIILEAKRQLLYSSLNIKEIAFELKFEEPSNFIRFFIRSTNMTPKQYRETSKERNGKKI
jgi:AraC-like DNA-binding protein